MAPAKNKKALQLIFLQQHSMDWRFGRICCRPARLARRRFWLTCNEILYGLFSFLFSTVATCKEAIAWLEVGQRSVFWFFRMCSQFFGVRRLPRLIWSHSAFNIKTGLYVCFNVKRSFVGCFFSKRRGTMLAVRRQNRPPPERLLLVHSPWLECATIAACCCYYS